MQLLPETTSVEDYVGLFVEILGDNVIKRSVVCSLCGKSGHRINSKRSGIMIHTTDYYLNKANDLAKKYHFKIGQKPA